VRSPLPPLAAALSVWSAGCAATAPETPALRPAPAVWQGAAASDAAETNPRWWTAFGDPLLDRLVEAAGSADDAALAEARLAEARARLRSARGALAPTLGAGVSGASQRVDDLDQSDAQAAGTLVFDPDLNGATRARSRSARASAEAAAARAAAVRIASRAEAVRLYATWREAEARVAAGDRAVRALSDALSLSVSRERAGLTSGLDPASARAALAAARARPAAAREAALTARLGLEALLGLDPGALAGEAAAAVPAAPPPSALATPVSVLARRPDLIAAERELAAAGFDAEAARRDFWPTLTLDAALGARASDPVAPFTPEGALVRVAAGLTAPLLTFGRLEGARDAADARRAQAAVRYRQAATRALSEVERALASARQAETRRETLSAAAEAAREQTRLAASRYRAGLTPFVDVLVAERALADAEADLAAARGDAARAYAALHLALGV
jgi:multidrug efflux system outer membrane protein